MHIIHEIENLASLILQTVMASLNLLLQCRLHTFRLPVAEIPSMSQKWNLPVQSPHAVSSASSSRELVADAARHHTSIPVMVCDLM
jgi:hypothetical protein